MRKIFSQKGQSLLFVIVAMTIALTVGVAIATRTITSIRRSSNTDTASRVFSAAEGGIEWFLRQPVPVLEKLSDGDANGGTECPQGTSGDSTNLGACVLTYEPQENDQIRSNATITVSKFNLNFIQNGESHYWFNLDPGIVKEVALKDYQSDEYYHGNLEICWRSFEESQSSALYYLTYGADGIEEKRIISPPAVQPGTVFDLSGDSVASGGRLDYDSCHTLNISGDTDLNGLRIKSLYAPSKIGVFPDSNGFPTQGFQISSLGKLQNIANEVTSSRQVTVYRSLPYAPSAFDYAIYSEQAIN